MKNYLLSIALILMLSYSYGQNTNYAGSKENKELLKEVLKKENEAEQRIVAYLQANPLAKRNVTRKDGSVMTMSDVMNGYPLYLATDNADAAIATGVNALQSGGSLGLDLDGEGMTVLIWDGGPVQQDHIEFQNASETLTRITNVELNNTDGAPTEDNHATHVAGTISAKGADASAKGMAPNVNVVTYNFNNANSEMIQALNVPETATLLSNHSWGLVIEEDGELTVPAWFIGAYTSNARVDDEIHHNNPYHLKVVSAGNDGTLSYTGGLVNGFDKLTGWSVGKNNLGVAWARPVLSSIPFTEPELIGLTISPSSNEGPTDDLRVKPDIAADGQQLYSPVTGGGYSIFSGTSMAAPNATGALVLLQEYYEQLNGVYMKSATAKGLVCHTAIDDDANIGPDPYFGWGFLNALEAANTIANNASGGAVIEERTLTQGEEYTFSFLAEAGEKIKASICWTDLPGVIATEGDANNQTPRLINDLDIRITKDGVIYEPWKLEITADNVIVAVKGDNIRDNVEIVEIDNVEAGEYTVTISHKGILQGNSGGPFSPQSQDYSLILTGNSVSLSTEDIFSSRNLAIYPNPSKGEFTISFDSGLISADNEVKIDIYDVSGRLVYKTSYENRFDRFNETLSLNNLKSGVYIANISQGQNTTSHKIIIE